MAVKRRRNKVGRRPDATVHYQSPNNCSNQYKWWIATAAVVLGVIAIVCLYTGIERNNVLPNKASVDPVTKQLPSNLVLIAQRYSYMGDVVTLQQFVNEHRRFNWTQLQYSGSNSTTLLHVALQGRHDSVSSSSTSLRGNHEVRV